MNYEHVQELPDLLELLENFNQLFQNTTNNKKIRPVGNAILRIYNSSAHDYAQKILLQSLQSMNIDALTELYSLIDSPKTFDELKVTINILAVLMQRTGWDGRSGIREYPPFEKEGIYWNAASSVADCLMAVAQTPKDVIEYAKTYLYDSDCHIILSALLHIHSWLMGGESRMYDLENFMPDLSIIMQEKKDTTINIIVKDIEDILVLKSKKIRGLTSLLV